MVNKSYKGSFGLSRNTYQLTRVDSKLSLSQILTKNFCLTRYFGNSLDKIGEKLSHKKPLATIMKKDMVTTYQAFNFFATHHVKLFSPSL